LFAFQPRAVQAAWSARLASVVEKPEVLKAFRERAETVRTCGYECIASDYVQGVTDISYPIMTGEAAIAALTVPYLRSASSPVDIDIVVEQLKSAVVRIAEDVVATL
jgi:DNA-binding IclR family transcriptional regulator